MAEVSEEMVGGRLGPIGSLVFESCALSHFLTTMGTEEGFGDGGRFGDGQLEPSVVVFTAVDIRTQLSCVYIAVYVWSSTHRQ